MDYAGFCGPSYPSQAYTADQERTVNFYFEQMESPAATSRYVLYPTPGVVDFLGASLVTAGVGGGGRAHFAQNGREFAIIGNTFLEIFEDGTFSDRGTVFDDGLPATIDSNGEGGNSALHLLREQRLHLQPHDEHPRRRGSSSPTRRGWEPSSTGTSWPWTPGTSTFYFSALLDGNSWSTGLDFAQRSGSGDPWVAMKVNRSYIYLLGEQTSEVWYDTGASFPFARHPSGQLAVGCCAQFSAAVVENNLLFLAATATSRGAVYKVSGFTPERVSTFAFETAIDAYGTIADAQGDTYYQQGHPFYVLSFPDEDKASWLWDSANGLWTEQGTWDPNFASDYVAWRPRWTVNIFEETRILHATIPAVYQLTSTSTGDAAPSSRGGDPIRRLRRGPAIVSELERMYYPAFEVDLQPAVGNTTPPGDDPQIMLRQSKDGGRNWTSERWASAGKVGEYGKRMRWNRCGMGRRMAFEVTMSDPVPWRVTNAYLPGVQLSKGRQLAKAS